LARFHASTAVGKTPLIAHCMIARELGGKIATRAVDFNLTVVRIRKRQRNKFSRALQWQHRGKSETGNAPKISL
jgi:hypothetical protein